MRREQQPSWVGPAVAFLLALILIGLAALVWITVTSEGEEEEHARSFPFSVSQVAIAPGERIGA